MTKAFAGGYLVIKQPMVRGGIHKHTAALPECVSDYSIEALNIIQATTYEIDPFIRRVMSEAADAGSEIGNIPAADPEPLPEPYPEEVWEAMDPSQRAEHKYLLSKIHSKNARREAKRESFNRKLAIATELEGGPIWFPHFYDFRLRAYPLAQDLHPQGDDISKSLLRFGDAEPLGEEGLYWLMVGLANAAGKDKLPFDQRVQWVLDNHDLIVDSVRYPLDGERFWASFEDDEPWGFLALAREYVEATEMDNPERYMSRRPVNMDGTCNGLQHLSLLGRDPVGALKTNCTSHPDRMDLYTEVAEVVKRIAAEDAANGVEEAVNWLAEGIGRNTVKRAVMTTPYGVTTRGIRDQLISDGMVKGLQGSESANALYMTHVIQRAVAETVRASSEIMGYFQDVALALGERNIPLRWRLPTGSEVVQSYYQLARKRVNTLCGRFVLWEEDKEMGLDARKQALAASPNVIHSYDAAMLQMTAVRLSDQGITSTCMIHDSYGTHAAYVSTLRDTLREVAYDIYKEDQLQIFHDYVKSYAPDVELPEPPARGDLDVSEVLRAEFFFA